MTQRRSHRWAWLAVAVFVVGCGSSNAMRSVQESRWQAVPSDARAQVERIHTPTLQQALEELRVAALALDRARQALERHKASRAVAIATPEPPKQGDAAWRAAWRAHENALAEKLGQIEQRKHEWLQADLKWRERRLDASDLRLAAARARFELAKAQMVSDYTPSDEGYEVSVYRGQFARLHAAWSRARTHSDEARAEVDRLSRELAGAKEQYARLRRDGGPGAPPVILEAADATPPRKPSRGLPHPW